MRAALKVEAPVKIGASGWIDSFCMENPCVTVSQLNAISIHLGSSAEARWLQQRGWIWEVPMCAVASKLRGCHSSVFRVYQVFG